jgi:hypothetical protein
MDDFEIVSFGPGDEAPPRVIVQLPGGRAVVGRLVAWRRGPGGLWWPDVVLKVPRAAISPMEGEDYSSVPRTGPVGNVAEWVRPRAYVVHERPVVTDGPRRFELHEVDCAYARGRARHLYIPVSPDRARHLLGAAPPPPPPTAGSAGETAAEDGLPEDAVVTACWACVARR